MFLKKRILIADDNEFSRSLLAEILEDNYSVEEVADGSEVIDAVRSYGTSISAVLLDVMMPQVTGIDVLRFFKELGYSEKVPVLMISSETDPEIEQTCLELGAFDFIHKPFDPIIAKSRIKNALTMFEYQNSLEKKVREKARQLNSINEAIVELMGNLVEARNLESGTHVFRVKEYARIIAHELMKRYPEYGLTENDVDLISATSALHDVGKIMIPDSILLKPGRLTSEEFEIMKTHSEKGYEIIKQMPADWDPSYFRFAGEICLYHHERFDGRGYPEGLKGDEIPIAAQIVAVADCCDALSTDRVYKKAFSMEVTFEMILGGQCGTFNPKVLDCFDARRSDIIKTHEKNNG